MIAFWFRRDLRLEDNAGLYYALKTGKTVLAVFIFDKKILDKLKNKEDARVSFIHQQLKKLQEELILVGTSLLVFYGDPVEIWEKLIEKYPIEAVYTNSDYELYAMERDKQVEKILNTKHRLFKEFKDHLIFEKNEIVKEDNTPYTVFTPYSKKWKTILGTRFIESEKKSFYLQSYPTNQYLKNFLKLPAQPLINLEDIGFRATKISFPPKEIPLSLIENYHQTRDYPAQNSTSRLGVHFRFGTISIRQYAYKALQANEVFLNELIWRDFYAMILYHFPHVAHQSFKPSYDKIAWRNDADDFEAWCEGRTGYPLVDAGMRELNLTGYMHNRVRMVVASFLSKHLLINWQWGEAYFAEKLLDFDLASNNGGWQWAAGSGTDAAPYFRIFNPSAQAAKFDKEEKYIRQWIPEYGTKNYPKPIVEHDFARKRCLEAYTTALKKDK